ncbi:alpha/beta fold hydrolase [Streptomyces olivaceoviridis]
MAWSERVVVRDGVRLACRDWGGPGQPIVLLHGLAGHAGEWDVLAGRLSSRYRVVAVDQRGHGASERHPRDVSRAAYVADVIAVVDQLALQRPALVGQSLGGHTAMLTAAAHPGLVRALVLVEAGPGGPNPNGPADNGGWLDSWPTPFPSREAAAAFLDRPPGPGNVHEPVDVGAYRRVCEVVRGLFGSVDTAPGQRPAVTHAASQVGAAEAVADAQEEVVGFTVPGRLGKVVDHAGRLPSSPRRRFSMSFVGGGGPPRPSLTCQQRTTLPTLPLTRQDSETLLGY